jgi:predicted nucleotidyltransferase
MKIQIEDRHLQIVLKILGELTDDAFVYGSRAKSRARPLSNLDLVIRASLPHSELARLRNEFEESNLPFKVDLALWNELEPSFQAMIERDLIGLEQSS